MSFLKTAGVSAVIFAVLLGLTSCGGEKEKVKLTDKQAKAVSERLAPVGKVAMEGEVASAASSSSAASSGPREPKTIFDNHCSACHATGAAGAPKFGDATAWAPRIAKGKDTLYQHALHGFKGMPPKGLCMDCSEQEIENTVDYMVSHSQ